MGYFKRKRTNKRNKKRGTKRYRGGAPDVELDKKLSDARRELETKSALLQTLIASGTVTVEQLIEAGNNLLAATTAYEAVVEEMKNALIILRNPTANNPTNGSQA